VWPRLLAPLVVLGCTAPAGRALHGRVGLTLLHTADTHSELFSYEERIGFGDARRGLGDEGAVASVGGFARLATLVRRERARAGRTLLLDSGDAFQGSLAFDKWGGEAELVGLSALGIDAQALGNHELDRGAEQFFEKYQRLATFPLLAANYGKDAESAPGVIERAVVLDAGGLRVAVIGVGNVSTVRALRERPNELGVIAERAAQAVQAEVDVLRPVVDVVVVLSHQGLDADRALVRRTSGVDVVLGGHQHIALDEPFWENDCGGSGEGSIEDAWGRARRCSARRVPIVHSGAYTRYLGRLALTIDDDPARLPKTADPLDAHEVTDAEFELLPLAAFVPEDDEVAGALEPYRPSVVERVGLGGVLGFAPALVPRIGATGGDSPLGNFAASAARFAAGAEIALLGSSSIRRDLAPGAIDAQALERSFPFDDSVLSVVVSGAELSAAFERAAASAKRRDCRSPVQVAGALVRMVCPCEAPPCAQAFAPETELCCRTDADCADVHGACSAEGDATGRCYLPLAERASYAVATTGYLADGGSGLLEPIASAARAVVAIGLREAVTDALHESERCASESVAACELGSFCRVLPCLDETSGAVRDGRIRIEPP
jgi:5'-nucleotidase